MFKKHQILFVCLGLLLLSGNAIAAPSVNPTENPDELVQDTECISSKILGVPTAYYGTEYGVCSKVCPRKCLYSAASGYSVRVNGFCIEDPTAKSQPYTCRYLSKDPNVTSALDKINFLGFDVDRAVLLAIRRAMLLVFAVAGVIIIGGGLYGTYIYSASEGEKDKIENAVKIFKSLAIGAVVLFVGVLFVQISANITGVTGSLFDFNFIPKTGRYVVLSKADLGTKCFAEQTADTSTGGESYVCDPETLTWVEGGSVCPGPGYPCWPGP